VSAFLIFKCIIFCIFVIFGKGNVSSTTMTLTVTQVLTFEE